MQEEGETVEQENNDNQEQQNINNMNDLIEVNFNNKKNTWSKTPTGVKQHSNPHKIITEKKNWTTHTLI